MKTLEQYLRENYEKNVIDHTIRTGFTNEGDLTFYIHPSNADGDTLDYIVDGECITPRVSNTPEMESGEIEVGDIVTIVDGDGLEIDMELLHILKVDGVEYYCMFHMTDDETEDGDLYFFKEDDGEFFIGVEDQDEFDKVYKEFEEYCEEE